MLMRSLVPDQGNRFRQARMKRFLSLVDRAGRGAGPVRILDVGGRVEFWEACRDSWKDRDLRITLVNLEIDDSDRPPVYELRNGNGCDLSHYADNSFDIVHSNSVIEHVGQWPQMRAMAAEVRRLAPHYFVQTPNLWFPYEPHYELPMIQFLPESARARLLLRKQRGYLLARDMDSAMEIVQGINLLDMAQFSALFPDARIERERFGPLTKSLIAIR